MSCAELAPALACVVTFKIPGEIRLPSYTARRTRHRAAAQYSDAAAMIFRDGADQRFRLSADDDKNAANASAVS